MYVPFSDVFAAGFLPVLLPVLGAVFPGELASIRLGNTG